MINRQFLTALGDKFTEYTDSFQSNDIFVQEHFRVKQRHSYKVGENMRGIGSRIGFDEDQLLLAEVIGLLHDIGRFEQYSQYGTFSDNNSVNHAELSVKAIKDLGLVEPLDAPVRELIYRSILNHNIPGLSKCLKSEELLYSRLLRDADKLDIYRVVKEYDQNNLFPEPQEKGAYQISDNIFNCFTRRQVVNIADAITKNDFYLLRVSWIFDINFQPTFQILDQQAFIEYMLGRLPKSYRLNNIMSVVKEYMVNRIFTCA